MLRFPHVAKELRDAVGQTLRSETQLERRTGLHQFGVGKLAGQVGGVVEGVEQVVSVGQDQGGRVDAGALLLGGATGPTSTPCMIAASTSGLNEAA